MKKYILIITLLAAANAALALFINNFTSWDDLTNQSPDIIIAKCTTTMGSSATQKPVLNIDGVISSDINVLWVLKGNAKLGPSRMMSQYWPYQGEQFLMIADYENDQNFKGFKAFEGYRIVPLNREFNQYTLDHYLTGKPLKEQIQWILDCRLKDLDDEMARDKDEKNRLEGFSKEK